MRPSVRPDIIPAKRTRKPESPAYTNHITDPNVIDSSPTAPIPLAAICATATQFNSCIAPLSREA
ncbi:hypothetical protein RHGRI_003382 [Rhododendron griersonianum]|uniref:Uncharacterized protein n=1 Tax=Rhododendron griersonianum TaxID=479676 RepID=A0AAV6L5J6_9ERIC|nr:hypothetical protein RHGRI_003382 [Rhododendron griersonianum]